MFETLEIFRTAESLARHAVSRQEVIATNIAQADTPGYRAQDVASFADSYEARSAATAMRRTREAHFAASDDTAAPIRVHDTPDAASPNGNTVSLETQMMKASQVRHEHELALSVYKSSLNILRGAIGRR
ncbi:FlgB family protein [Celeribacter indicus]|uniref:Flagellar basal body rod protein FlgB n=1 Tax=Celeribacter indicus TaxID=1208324 RepID=A0A0B5DMD6_9RHOB|nr:FlgB family protein [Celeribacter indicus]AJE44808.1 flagellar basal body rod protein FlgB [Celeribacter indicus]SDX24547.1 flagellar basal-body rod protein FlgB [Celeribacter indicus]